LASRSAVAHLQSAREARDGRRRHRTRSNRLREPPRQRSRSPRPARPARHHSRGPEEHDTGLQSSAHRGYDASVHALVAPLPARL